MFKATPALLLWLGLPLWVAAAPTLTVDAAKPVAKASPTLYGLMTEEINHCYDGGLYAELVQNRAFLDDAKKPAHWSAVARSGARAEIALDHANPLNEHLPVSLRLDVAAASPDAHAGIANTGYWGMPVKPSTTYRASFYARAAAASGPVAVALESEDGATVYARAEVPALTSGWQRHEVSLTTGKNAPATTKARLVLTVSRPGTVWFSLVSLFPPTWNNRPNGLRPDLMRMLVELRPAFLRFPGGNYLEGDTVDKRFDWKKTLGPIETRPGHQGPWGYRSTDGLGLLEFLEWCEDMGAEPVLAVYAGYSLGGSYIKPGEALEPYVQEALEEIEYVTGPVTSKWGAIRARDGHPEPFKLRYVEIGNEDWFDKSGSYDGRFAQFFDAIKAKHPTLKCISSIGGEQPAERRVRSRRPDVVDEHYYRPTEEFLKDSPRHFDKYDRKGPEVFVGEWAAHETAFPPWDKRSKDIAPTPNMKAAIGDAAWMIAMERNSDLVTMQCYAPLFVNVNAGAYQWRPNLIGYDALRSFGSPSYHAFKLFSLNQGDEILAARLGDTTLQAGASRDSRTGEIILKIVNPETTAQAVKIALADAGPLSGTVTALTLAAAPTDTNSLTEPEKVVPATTRFTAAPSGFTYTVPAYSVIVLKFAPPSAKARAFGPRRRA